MRSKWVASGALVATAVVTLAACGSSGGSSSASSSGGKGKTVASGLILGAAPEFKTRIDGIPGLSKVYDVSFGNFKPLDAGGPLTINALKNGQIDAGDIYTTDPSVKADKFVVLKDPKSLYLAQNVLPLIAKSKATPGVTKALNAVSAKLTTSDLISLNQQVETEKKDPKAVAQAWLTSKGLNTKGTEAAGTSLTVGSANFQENVVLADVYAAALSDQGAKVSTKLNIGSRETYIPALEQGSIDVIPEYSGVLLQYFDKNTTAKDSADVFTALQKAAPAKLTVLQQSAAQDKDAIVVTAATAAKYHLSSIADLAKKQ